MDITSFSLGILFVLVVGMLAVTVYNMVLVHRLRGELESLDRVLSSTYNDIYRTTERKLENMASTMDSRFDKFTTRIDKLDMKIHS